MGPEAVGGNWTGFMLGVGDYESAGRSRAVIATVFSLIVVSIVMSSFLILGVKAGHPDATIRTAKDALLWSTTAMFGAEPSSFGDHRPVTMGGRMIAIWLVFGVAPLRFGAHAEYMVVAENSPVDHRPSPVAPEQAVIVEGFWYAYNALRHMALGGGKKLLIFEGSGAIGSAAIQLAKYYGAQPDGRGGVAHRPPRPTHHQTAAGAQDLSLVY